jgi:serine/threonine protein kinase
VPLEDAPPAADTALRHRLETVFERFEGAWLGGGRPVLDDFLPAAGPERAALLPELVLIDLECRFKAGEAVRLEPYLTRYPDLAGDTAAVLRCLAQEFTLRRRREPDLRPAEFHERFPQYRAWLGALLPADPTAAAVPPVSARLAIPGYEILGLLGRGGMGVVYHARDLRHGRLVALKVIRGDDHFDPEPAARFRAEAEAVARLKHPNIVEIYEVGDLHGRPYLALEYVAGGSLRRRLAYGPLAAADAAALIATLARAVQFVHDHGILHRDLKPDNILLPMGKLEWGMGNEGGAFPLHPSPFPFPSCEFATPKITDFGLARRLGTATAQTPSGWLIGTPGYMAPEQAAGPGKEVGPAADVWGLGAILYECLTGRPPFAGAAVLELLRQVADDDPVPPRRLVPEVPAVVEVICLKCLHKEPARRYASAAALADALAGSLAAVSPVAECRHE